MRHGPGASETIWHERTTGHADRVALFDDWDCKEVGLVGSVLVDHGQAFDFLMSYAPLFVRPSV